VTIQNNRPFAARTLLHSDEQQSPHKHLGSSADAQGRAPFVTSTLRLPSGSTVPSALRTPARTGVELRVPRLLVPREREFHSCWHSLAVLLRPTRLRLYTTRVQLFQHTPGANSRFAGKALALSIVLHIAGFLWLPYRPSGSLRRALPARPAFSEPGKIYYRLTLMDLSEKIPRIDPQARGPQAASPSLVAPSPPESTETHAKLTIILRPPHPDNAKQSIYQSVAAPDLRITPDLKLPNLILQAAAVPKPQFRFNPNDSKPLEVKKSVVAESAPTLATAVNSSVIPLAELPGVQPHLPVPPPPPASTQSQESLSTPDGALSAGKVGSGLVTIRKDPGQATAAFSLPIGDSWSEISISSAGGASGVAGDKPGGNANGRNTGEGTGGDASTGLGHSDSRGSGTAEVLTIGGNGSESLSLLDPMLPENMVFAVPASVLPRKKAFVVSAGPIGGGGLDVYGALHCGKIDTIFVQMRGPSWTLQFCQAKRKAATNESRGRSLAIRLEQGLVPPEVELKFDFRRLPVPQGTAHKLILLKGFIRADGGVEQVEVFRGVQPQMDEAARVAFSRWRFRPAMRESQPVDVEILVGIPSDMPVVRVPPSN
jgi:hypothetical protein